MVKLAPEELATDLQKVLEEERALRVKAVADKDALISEFSKANTPDEVRDTIVKKAREAGVSAILKINHLIDHAEKEATQFSASKYIIDLIMSGTLDGKDGGIQDLIDKLTAITSDNAAKGISE